MARVLGIDPGLLRTGYGIVVMAEGQFEPRLIEAGVIALDGKLSLEERLGQLHDELAELIGEQQPHRVAVEELYAHYRHPRTAILMAHARGVILLCAQKRGIPVEHYAATAIKKSVTGYGQASKQQMQSAVQAQCRLASLPSPPDVADAIAVALVCARRIVEPDVESRESAKREVAG